MPDVDEADFDSYLNEVSGEDVTSGSPQGELFRADPTVAPQEKPEAKAPQFDKPQAKQPALETKTVASANLRPHALGGFVNAEGDIVNEQGAIIAQKGTVRRVYEENGRLKNRLAELEKQGTDFASRRGEADVLNGAPTRLGLDNTDVAQALDLAARVKRGDIVGVAKELVARAVAEGRNVTEIVGTEVGDSVDMRALKQMLDSHLGPISQIRKDNEQEQVIQTKAKQAYDKFVDENPYADLHQFEVASIARSQNISPQKAYNALRDFAIRHSFDFSIPLAPQVQALAIEAQRTGGQPPATQVRPMPNGAAVTSGNGIQSPQPTYADPNDDWGTIIREAQRTMRQ